MMASKSLGVMNMYFCFTERRTQAVLHGPTAHRMHRSLSIVVDWCGRFATRGAAPGPP